MTGKELVLASFDYSQIDDDLAGAMRDAATRVRHLVRASVIDVGHELLRIKDRLEHGQFAIWVRRECQLHIRTAERAMQAAITVAENDKLSYLPPDGVLALRSGAAPKPLVREIIEEIVAGARPTAAEIKRRIAAGRQPNATRPNDTPAREGSVPTGTAQEQLAALMAAWGRAGPEAREAFLAEIGAAPQIQMQKAANAEQLEPTTGAVGNGLTTTRSIADAEHQSSELPKPSALALDRPEGDGLEPIAHAKQRPPTPSEALPDDQVTAALLVAAHQPTASVEAPTVVAVPPCESGNGAVTLDKYPEQQKAALSDEAATPEVCSEQHNPAAEASPTSSLPPDDGGLTAIAEKFKRNTRQAAVRWVQQGCLALTDPPVHHAIIRTLEAQFCPAAAQASPVQRQRFLDLMADPPRLAA